MAAKIFLTLPSGQKMPAIGLGTWQAQDATELENALDAALELGYRHIDTAYVYENEAIIGRVLKKWFDSGKIKREDLFITTKLPMVGIHQDRVHHFIKKSLENLQLNYVDLYLIHFPVGTKFNMETQKPLTNEKGVMEPEPVMDHIAIWKKMEELVDAGYTKNIGLSNFNIKQIDRVLKSARIKPANLQVELHVYLQQQELVDFCQKNGLTVVAYSPLGSPGYNKFLIDKFGIQGKPLPNMLNDQTIKTIADKHSKKPAQIMLRFLLQRNIAAIPKSVTASRLKENIDVFDFKLDATDMKQLFDLELGEDGRVCDFKVFKGIIEHPDFPFKK